jgi:hypothetical protein
MERAAERHAATKVWSSVDQPNHYRVRARNARIRAMRRITLKRTCKLEAVEPHTIAIIMK